MARAFGRDTPVLAPRARNKGKSLWLLWPALQYRVVTPLVEEPLINVFQRGLLRLARTGIRELSELAALLGLEIEFAELVRDDLRTMRYLDEFGAPTDRGLAALNDGFLDPSRIVVTHVYQDPFTGMVWPASVQTPMTANATWVASYRARIDLDSERGPGTATALEVPPADADLPDPPEPGEVIEQVGRGHRIQTWGEAGPRLRQRPPQRIVTRVNVLNAGEPVYLPVQIITDKRNAEDEEGLPTWLALNPFIDKPSERLRRTVAVRCASHEPLRKEVERLIGRPSPAFLAAYDRIKAQRRDHYRERFALIFDSRLENQPDLLELLTVMEFHWDDAEAGATPHVDRGAVAHYAWRAHEVILRDLPTTWPVSLPTLNGPKDPVWPLLMGACERIGLDGTQYLALNKFESLNLLTQGLDRILGIRKERPVVPDLLVTAVLSADQGGPDHPIRRLVGAHPNLLTVLNRAAKVRHDSSHAAIEPIAPDLAASARNLAFATTAAFLGCPLPTDHGDNRKESSRHAEAAKQ